MRKSLRATIKREGADSALAVQLQGLLSAAAEDSACPPFPQPLRHLWSAFLALHQGRTYSMGGPNPITYESMLAWVTLTGTDLSAWDVEVIKTLDMVWLKAMGEDQDG